MAIVTALGIYFVKFFIIAIYCGQPLHKRDSRDSNMLINPMLSILKNENMHDCFAILRVGTGGLHLAMHDPKLCERIAYGHESGTARAISFALV